MSGIRSPHYGNLPFPATQVASSDVNTLDDYEEGTWTPAIVGTTVAGTATYSFQDGSYVKIGKFVHACALIGYSGHTGTGNMQISGLPFTMTGPAAAVTFEVSALVFAAGALQGRISGTTIVLETIATAGAATALPIDAAATIRLSVTYIA